jgi:hypothetical protein
MLYIKEILAILVLTIVVAGNLGDVFYDYREGASMSHLLMEFFIAVVSFTLIAGLTFGIWRQSRSNSRLKGERQRTARLFSLVYRRPALTHWRKDPQYVML